MEQIVKLAQSHLFASHAFIAAFAIFCARIDSVILFLLRFFDAETIKTELDRLEVLAKHEVDKEAALKAAATSTAAPPPVA